MSMQRFLTLAAAIAVSAVCASSQNLVATNTDATSPLSATTSAPAAHHTKSVKDIKPAKLPPAFLATITDGTLTVDGMIAKARLNYAIRASYIYFFVPDLGAVVVAQKEFDGAKRQKKAFRGSSLIVSANGHVIELSSAQGFAPNRGKDAYVYVDANYRYPDARYPVIGFGDTRNAPYVWPGSKATPAVETGRNLAPPLPKNLQPRMEVVSSYSVVVRPATHQ